MVMPLMACVQHVDLDFYQRFCKPDHVVEVGVPQVKVVVVRGD